MSDPSLGQVRDEIVAQLGLDSRVRGVEIKQASQDATLSNLASAVHAMRDEHRQDKNELLEAIKASKPNPWPIVAAFIAFAGVLIALVSAVYSQS